MVIKRSFYVVMHTYQGGRKGACVGSYKYMFLGSDEQIHLAGYKHISMTCYKHVCLGG